MCADRQAARLCETKGFAKKLRDVKLKTGDEGLIILKDADREEDFFVSTLKNYESLLPTNNAETSTSTPSTSLERNTPPSFWKDVAAMSPEAKSPNPKFPQKATARKFKDSKHCRVCNIAHNSKKDEETNSPWMSCKMYGAVGKMKKCGYWVHSVCWGLQGSKREIEEIEWYCPDHNQRGKNIKAIAARVRKKTLISRKQQKQKKTTQKQKGTSTSTSTTSRKGKGVKRTLKY